MLLLGREWEGRRGMMMVRMMDGRKMPAGCPSAVWLRWRIFMIWAFGGICGICGGIGRGGLGGRDRG